MNRTVERRDWRRFAIVAGVVVVTILGLLALGTPVTAVGGAQDTSNSASAIMPVSENEDAVSEHTPNEKLSNSGDVGSDSADALDAHSTVNDTIVERDNSDGAHNGTDEYDKNTHSTAETVTATDTVLEEERLRKFFQWQDIPLASSTDEYASMDSEGFEELAFSDPYFNMEVDNAQNVDLSGEYDDAWLRFEAYHGTRSSGDLYPVFGPSYSDVEGLDHVYWSEEPLKRDDASTSWDHHAVRLDTGPYPTFTEYLDHRESGELHFYQTVDEGSTTSGWRVRDASIGVPIVDNPETKTSSDVSVSVPEDTEYIKDVWVTFDYERHSESSGLRMEVGDTLWVTPTDLDGDSGTHERWVSPTAFDSEDTTQLTFKADSGVGGVAGGDYTIRNVEVEWVLEVQDFEVEIVDTNSPVTPGDDLEVTVDISNPGPADSTERIAVDAGSLGSDSTSIQLDGHESTTETFSISTNSFDSGSYSVTVSSDDDSDSESVNVLEPAEFDVSITNTNAPIEAGETLEVTAEIENEGDVSESQTIALNVDGLGSDSTTVHSLDGGDSTMETLTVSTSSGDAGSYSVTVEGDDDSDSTSVEVNPQMDTLSITSTPDDASVYLDGEYVGETPWNDNRPASESYEVEVDADGYEPVTRTVSPPADEHFDLETETETLSITSTPDDADVYVDGDYVGTTPWSEDRPVTESYDIEVDKDGYEPELRSDISPPADEEFTLAEIASGELRSVDHPSIVAPDGSFTVTINTAGSSSTVVEFEPQVGATFDLELSNDDAAVIDGNRVEFLDPTAGDSTHEIDVDISGGQPVDGGEIHVWINAENHVDADDELVSTFELGDTHSSGVSQTLWNGVTDNNAPTNDLTLQDLIDTIQLYQNDAQVNGVHIAFQDLIDLIMWYQSAETETTESAETLSPDVTPTADGTVSLTTNETVAPGEETTVLVETEASAGTVVEFDPGGASVALSSEDAVSIDENRVEFLDVSADDSTYEIDVDVLDGAEGDTVDVDAWVNAEDRTNADDTATSSFEIASGDESTVGGTVMTADGNPLEAVEIEIYDPATNEIETTTITDENGVYSIELEATRTYQLVVDEDGFERFSTDITVEPAEHHTEPVVLTAVDDPGEDDTPVVVGNDPATDTTGDGKLNDLDGDGEFTIIDVQVLFENLENDAIQENANQFDFSGAGGDVTIADVQALFELLQEQ